jgi:hypothetical protein
MKKYKNGKVSFEMDDTDYILIILSMIVIGTFCLMAYAMHLGLITK